MEKIDLKKLIEKYKLGNSEVAKHLFPENNYPVSALKRVLNGSAFLDSNQLSKLALLCGIKIHELWGTDWRVKDIKKGGKVEGIISFTADTYTAELDTRNWITKVFDRNTLIHETVIFPQEITLSKYLKALTTIIEEYKEPLM